jgi:hypothetical protein
MQPKTQKNVDAILDGLMVKSHHVYSLAGLGTSGFDSTAYSDMSQCDAFADAIAKEQSITGQRFTLTERIACIRALNSAAMALARLDFAMQNVWDHSRMPQICDTALMTVQPLQRMVLAAMRKEIDSIQSMV